MSDPQFLRIAAEVDSSNLRTAEFMGDEHLVVPVVALVGDSVVRPMGSAGPEFVPAEELAATPGAWNGRPVLPDHPKGASSANDPETLEAEQFGQVFNSTFENGRLKVEAWLNRAAAERIGEAAQDVIRRFEAGEMVEVSVGAWVAAEKRSGSHNGKPYEFVWHDVVPDHLAMLPEGTKGACSIEMGCGAPRMNQDGEAPKMTKMQSMFNRFLESVGITSAEVGDATLRDSLHSALFAVEPAFEGIIEVFPDSGTVVYMTFPEETMMLWERGFSVDDEANVTLADEAAQVEQVTGFQPVKAARADPGDSDTKTAQDGDCPCNHQGEPPMTKDVQELVGRLVACERSPFTEADAEWLAAAPEERLRELADNLPKPAPEPAAPTPQTEAEWLEAAPEGIRSMVERYQNEEASRRASLVLSLAAAQTVYSAEALETKPTEELASLAKILKLDEPTPDFSGRPMPVAAKAGTIEKAPCSYGLDKETN
jgi:hypothetical protein